MRLSSDFGMQPVQPIRSNGLRRITIVADDLTGACDSGAAFAASGHTVRVLVDAASANDTADVLIVSTESRDLTPELAAASVSAAIEKLLPSLAGGLLVKKIDSAARGAFAMEIEAALSASQAALALVTPTFPAMGRTVSNGILSVRDWSGQNAEIALPNLFAASAALRLAVLPILPEGALHDAIKLAIENKVRILLCDAVEQSDLDRLAAAALRIEQPILWAGSAGLARALAAQLQVVEPVAATNRAGPIVHPGGRALLFAGSPHPVTVLQVKHLEDARFRDGSHRCAIHRVPEAGALPETVVSVFAATSPAALILTGGDTAAFVLRALGAHAIRLGGEVAPGIPWGLVEGGLADGCTVVTKSGGFGERDALVRAYRFCESELCESEMLG